MISHTVDKTELPVFFFLCAVLLALTAFGYRTLELDHPIGIATTSRALYVDEGFYSDAAQNWVKFGQWSFPYDSRHWVGVPFVAVFRSQIFSWFGVSLETARLSSIFLSFISCLAFYFIVRTRLKPFLAAALTIAGALTITYAAHARSALAEPTATCFALLAILAFVRVKNKNIAIPLSVTFASVSFLSKLLFLHVLTSIVVLWSFELLILPFIAKHALDKRAISIFGLCLAGVAFLFIIGTHIFQDEIAVFRTMLSDKYPIFHPVTIIKYVGVSLTQLGYPTKSHFFSWAILVCVLGFFVKQLIYNRSRRFGKNRNEKPEQKIFQFGRAETAMATWLFVALVLIGSMGQQKTHYYFFAILPLSFLGAVSLRLLVPKPFQTAAIIVLILCHVLIQIPYYVQWSERTLKTALFDASRDMVYVIHQQSRPRIIPVMGEYSAQLALFSDRMVSLDAYWHTLPYTDFCGRLKHWRPRFHVNIVLPGGSRDSRIVNAYAKCDFVSYIEELRRYPLPKPEDNVILLRRVHYRT